MPGGRVAPGLRKALVRPLGRAAAARRAIGAEALAATAGAPAVAQDPSRRQATAPHGSARPARGLPGLRTGRARAAPQTDAHVYPRAGGAAAELAAVDALLATRPGSSLADPGGFLALEVWTECELSALHALARLVRASPTPARLARFDELCRWHLEHTQPDNATNRPWALHAFARRGDAESHLYAETLLHNVAASDARHEPLSRWILLDAARELAAAPTGPGRA